MSRPKLPALPAGWSWDFVSYDRKTGETSATVRRYIGATDPDVPPALGAHGDPGYCDGRWTTPPMKGADAAGFFTVYADEDGETRRHPGPPWDHIDAWFAAKARLRALLDGPGAAAYTWVTPADREMAQESVAASNAQPGLVSFPWAATKIEPPVEQWLRPHTRPAPRERPGLSR